jgi:hypothetical protein
MLSLWFFPSSVQIIIDPTFSLLLLLLFNFLFFLFMLTYFCWVCVAYFTYGFFLRRNLLVNLKGALALKICAELIFMNDMVFWLSMCINFVPFLPSYWWFLLIVFRTLFNFFYYKPIFHCFITLFGIVILFWRFCKCQCVSLIFYIGVNC